MNLLAHKKHRGDQSMVINYTCAGLQYMHANSSLASSQDGMILIVLAFLLVHLHSGATSGSSSYSDNETNLLFACLSWVFFCFSGYLPVSIHTLQKFWLLLISIVHRPNSAKDFHFSVHFSTCLNLRILLT